jgi:hypothetical protein
VGRRAESDGLPPPGPIDIPRLKEIGARFGIDIVGPPMTPARAAVEDAVKERR